MNDSLKRSYMDRELEHLGWRIDGKEPGVAQRSYREDEASRIGLKAMSDSLNLAKRAIAAGWRWQAGTVTGSGLRVTDTYKDGLPCAWTFTDGEHFAKPFNNYGIDEYRAGYWSLQLPDFSDAPTRAVLLEQVRERWGTPLVFCAPEGPGSWYVSDTLRTLGEGPTETAALVAALEAKS